MPTSHVDVQIQPREPEALLHLTGGLRSSRRCSPRRMAHDLLTRGAVFRERRIRLAATDRLEGGFDGDANIL